MSWLGFVSFGLDKIPPSQGKASGDKSLFAVVVGDNVSLGLYIRRKGRWFWFAQICVWLVTSSKTKKVWLLMAGLRMSWDLEFLMNCVLGV